MVDVINFFQGYTKGTHNIKKADIVYDELSHIFMNTLAALVSMSRIRTLIVPSTIIRHFMP